MPSVRCANRKLRQWERYLRRYRKFFGDQAVRSQRGHYRAWEALAAARRRQVGGERRG
ncbi:hypothetical protein Acsp01_86860 [Actinoplanes sp. NBRC 101535]|nr:hypothetical protein Acsp01_86860 [Actinoplanes sp. NBRC 101535]